MPRFPAVIAAVALVAVCSGANAQVFRCGASRVYTDKPCEQARPVDVRPNIVDAGTRQIPADPPPAPAVIPPSAYQPKKTFDSSGSIFDRRDTGDAEFRSRTTAPAR